MWHAAAVFLATIAPPEEHHIVAAPGSVQWGYHDASVPPALTIRSGDTVVVETLVTGARLLRTFGVTPNA